MFLQSCLRWRDELHIVLRCEEFPPGLVNVCAFAGSIIQQDHEPLDDAYCIVWYVTWFRGQQEQCLSEFLQYRLDCPRSLLAISSKIGHSVASS